MSARDADRIFHETWLGLAQPIEGLVFSVPVLAEAQIAPAARPEITMQVRSQLVDLPSGALALQGVRRFFEAFLGYDAPGMLVGRDALPTFYAPESRQEVRASFAIARAPAPPSDDPFAEFAKPATEPASLSTKGASPFLALVWDLADDTSDASVLDLDAPEEVTGPWRYPPTAKLERLLRHTGIAIGFLSNRRALRLVYAPPGETTSHLTFRMDDLADPAGRPIALALELLLHARRTYGADPRFNFAGLLAESRRRQADVTEKLAEQVFDAVESLLTGFEGAAVRDCTGDRVDWMRAAMEAGHVHEGVLNEVLRLVFLLYAEDRSLLPIDHPFYAEHLSVLALYERLVRDAGAHPESMHHRFGAYGALTTLFRAIYFGVRHGTLHLPPRQGKLFDPSAYPFLEGGLPDWTAAVNLAEDRAQVQLPSVDDKTIHDVLHGLVVLDGQRLSYRDLSVEQIGAVYESLMGYHVLRVAGPAVRLGKNGVWVEIEELRSASKTEQKKLLEDRCDLSAAAIKNVVTALTEHGDDDAAADAIAALSGKKSQLRNRARLAQLVLQPTASRRSTGSHYTPRSLSERVVRRTLEPILACLGDSPAASRILQLKVCDPAMGSGAFLVEACRFLGEQVVEAWRRSGELPAMIETHGEPLLHAKRLVAERCLYGVDKNAAAVELAKLSLWLETMSADKSFTFLDHVLRHGNSLVGLDPDQIRAFHWAPEKQLPMVKLLVDQALVEVREHREAIHALADDESDFAQSEKRRLLELAELAMDRVKLVADACVGAFFAGDKPKSREEERKKRLRVVEAWLGGDDGKRGEVEEWSREIREKHPPFHWHLELPEVFFLERPDPLEDEKVNRAAFVDAFVGNPPFAGKNGVVSLGDGYLDWLQTIHAGAHGNADLSAHFFRRVAALLGAHGTLGLIATNTISQGDTRATGLQHLVTRERFAIHDATRSMSWPGDAAVSVSVVLLAKGRARESLRVLRLDGEIVTAISSRLRPTPEQGDPIPLRANEGCSFQGSIVLGMGFTLAPKERDALVAKNKKNAERSFPYLGGQEVNTSPTQEHDRYVISFGQMSLEEAGRWPDLLAIVRDKVKPERDQNKRDVRREYWWRFGEVAPALYEAISNLNRCLVTARTSKHTMFSLQPTDRVFSENLVVFALCSQTAFAVLQSRVHTCWVAHTSSTLETRQGYRPSDCFETFPFPRPEPRALIPLVEEIGERLYAERATYMIDTNQGLTQTYNQLKDPKCDEPLILTLRQLHEDTDRAVLNAYGWTDLVVPRFCPKTPDERGALEEFQDTVIDRLFALNAERAEEEKRLGAAKPTKGKKASAAEIAAKTGRKSKTTGVQSELGFKSSPTGEDR